MSSFITDISIWQYSLLIISYLIGSFPTGYIMGRVVYGINLFDHGSKNVGATNALRVLGKKAGLTVLLIDALKGAIPVLVVNHATQLNYEWSLAVGVSSIFGHTFSPFIRFKGGKGVATSAGTFLALVPEAFGTSFATFVCIVILTKFVSLGSILASISLPIACAFLYPSKPALWQACSVLAIFITYKHRSNVGRLIRGEENRLDWSKK